MKFLLLASLLVALAAPVAQAQVRDTAAARLAGGERWQTDFRRRTVPSGEIVSGGPPKDGIPAIDRPRFETALQANQWLSERDPVMVVEHGGAVRAYPLRILIWHEIVNDQVAGLPVAVTFCPLCNTALVFDRRLAGRMLDFGTTGRLRHSDLVMYDRQTESWWQQATGEGIVGRFAGSKLRRVPSTILAWGTARTLHPDIRVLSRSTGFDRDYGRNPYVSYDSPIGRPFAEFFRRRPDPRLPAMERLIAVELGRGWAVPVAALRRVRVVNARAGDIPFTVFWTSGAASALDRGEVADGRDVGQSAAFDRRLQGRVLTFRPVRNGFQDRETGSFWDLAGRAVSGPLRGQRLQAVPHDNPFWFAWITFRPQTEVWRP